MRSATVLPAIRAASCRFLRWQYLLGVLGLLGDGGVWKTRFRFGVWLPVLASLEPVLAAVYWPCLQAKSLLEDRRANQQETGKGVGP